jgi:transcriptional regulator with XRE-family HTH domain
MKLTAKRVSEAFGKALMKLRMAKGQSQVEVAAKAGLDRTFISFLERGLRQPTLLTLLKIAAAFRLKPSKVVAKVEEQLPMPGVD